jgi:unsaturated rhamnogalacturonyl hydrolase
MNKTHVTVFGLALALAIGYFHPMSADAKPRKECVKYSVWMGESEMKRHKELWMADFVSAPKWDYTQGLMALAMLQLADSTGDKHFFEYAKGFADKFIDESGTIATYKMEEYNIDKINPGKFLIYLYRHTKEEKYKKAVDLLRHQLDTHPRTTEGGFWHKKIYTSQMWLDGLYMGAPFYALYAKEYNQPADFDDVVKQFVLVNKHTYDPKTGLNYHGWDELKAQRWANKETGCSPNFWGRAMGWYAMGLVDALSNMPADYKGREELIAILHQVAAGIKKYQDPTSGVWYQVLDQGARQGNYLEATASSMFVYALYKGVRLGYLDKSYLKVAKKGYDGILKHFIVKNSDGTISLTSCCAVAGLGGNPYRDGSYEYYINEVKRDNDPKGVGPFIMASLEVESICRHNK